LLDVDSEVSDVTQGETRSELTLITAALRANRGLLNFDAGDPSYAQFDRHCLVVRE
jgi:hypothetical protein